MSKPMTKSGLAIETRQLSKTFGAQVVLDQIDLEIAEGQTMAILGANGAGKTTLLGCLASIIRPTGGDIFWFRQPAAGNVAARRLIGMVAHQSFLYPHLTVRENLLFAARMYGVACPAERTDELLSSVALGPYRHRFLGQLSRGMRQRLALARAIVHDPPILLLDEPFAGLDTAAADWLGNLLSELHGRSRTVCFTTHDRQRACRQADRIIRLHGGRIVELAGDCPDFREHHPQRGRENGTVPFSPPVIRSKRAG